MVPERDVGTNILARYSLHAGAVQLLLQEKELAAPKTTPIARRETYQDYKRKNRLQTRSHPSLTPRKAPSNTCTRATMQRHAL